MVLPWSVRSAGQAPSTVHLVFGGAGFSGGAAAASPVLASVGADGDGAGAGGDDGLGDGDADGIGTGEGAGARAGVCATGALAAGVSGRGGSFRPGAGRDGSIGGATATGGDARSLLGGTGSVPLSLAQNATPVPASNVSTTA